MAGALGIGRVWHTLPGTGVGGHCIAVDPWFIINKTPKEAHIIHAARQVNNNKSIKIFHRR